MAVKEQLSILKQGIDVWNKWREDNPGLRPHLENVDLSNAHLQGMNLSFAQLSFAKLSGAILCYTDLSFATLYRADLSSANLRDAQFSSANLSGTNLNFADLRRAYLHSTALRGVRLHHADLSSAHLIGVDLRDAQLNHVNLINVTLENVILSGADFSHTNIGWTVFSNVDLNEVKELETVKHQGPSTIGVDTIYKSKGNIPEIFLRGTGVPDGMIVFMKSPTNSAIGFYSCFISYSSQDKPFVEWLYADLQAKGVRCWYAPEDLKIGEPFLLGIEQGIRLHDKLLLVLSKDSVTSGWVQHEVLSAMAKEQGKAPWVLFPIMVDDAIMNTSVPWANMIKQSRHIGDFTHWKDHDAYQTAFDRLLRDLKAEG